MCQEGYVVVGWVVGFYLFTWMREEDGEACTVCTWEIKHTVLKSAEEHVCSPENQQLSQSYRR